MALTETGLDRRILSGVCPVTILLAGAVQCGDPIKYSTGWKLATNESGKPAILFAGESGDTGDYIVAYAMAVIELEHTLANVPTMGQQLALADAGTYDATVAANYQDIGYIVEVDADSLHSRALVCGIIVELDAAGV